MKKSILTLVAFALTILTASADSTNKQHGSIKIVAETRPEINYATHLYTLAELGFKDDEYSAKYIGTVAKADLDTLRKYKDLLSFGRGEGSMFAGMFFFAVGGETFSDSKDLQDMIDRYRKMAEEQIPGQDMTIPNAIAKVFVNNYELPFSFDINKVAKISNTFSASTSIFLAICNLLSTNTNLVIYKKGKDDIINTLIDFCVNNSSLQSRVIGNHILIGTNKVIEKIKHQ